MDDAVEIGTDSLGITENLTSSTARTQVCIVMQGLPRSHSKQAHWPLGAEDFVRRLYKQGCQISVVGPRPENKIGPRRQLKFFDRHEVLSLKRLARAKSQSLELKVTSRKLKAWTRIRTEICIVSANSGVWVPSFPGWSSSGMISVDALARMVNEFCWVPGRKFILMGSTNQEMLWGCRLLDLGAEEVMIIEPHENPQCWRSHRDRFLQKSGKLYLGHSLTRVQESSTGVAVIYLNNSTGTLVLEADTIVLSPVPSESFNESQQWKEGLYYIQRRDFAPEDEEAALLSKMDWAEAYWKISKALGLTLHAESSGAIERLRSERKQIFHYRKDLLDFHYQGKTIDKSSIDFLKKSGAVPTELSHSKPIASLECFEFTACTACIVSCPHEAITKAVIPGLPQLKADACTGCGACVAVCPSSAAVMVKDFSHGQSMRYFLPDDTRTLWKGGEAVQVLNRQGELLATGKVIASNAYQNGHHRVLEIEAPSYIQWDARSFRQIKSKDAVPEAQSLIKMKRGWVTLNGAKRLCPVDVPLTMALWQLGYRRFEDALFCQDKSCRMCAVFVNGVPTLACREIVKEGAIIEFRKKDGPSSSADCYCKNANFEDVERLTSEGVSPSVARDLTGFGRGVCRGRWCESRCKKDSRASANGDQKQRPRWVGFHSSPWFELWQEDILPPKNGD